MENTLALIDNTSHGSSRTGQSLIDGALCRYGDAVRPGDLVKANFDRCDVGTGGGLYLVQQTADSKVVWSGCRRMTRLPGGVAVDNDGEGNWTTVASLDACHLHVVATVEAVYRDVYNG